MSNQPSQFTPAGDAAERPLTPGVIEAMRGAGKAGYLDTGKAWDMLCDLALKGLGMQSETVARQDIPEGRGSLPAGALERGSPLDAARGVNPGGAAPGGVGERSDDKLHSELAQRVADWRGTAKSGAMVSDVLQDILRLEHALAEAKDAVPRIDPMEFGRLKAELSAIERHLNKAGVQRVSERQATSDRVYAVTSGMRSAGVARIECSNCGAKYERYEAPCPHCSFSAVPSATAPWERVSKDSQLYSRVLEHVQTISERTREVFMYTDKGEMWKLELPSAPPDSRSAK